MLYLPQIVAALIGLILGLVLGMPLIGLVLMVVAACVGGWLAKSQAPGSEWVYWAVAGVIAVLFALSLFDVPISRFVMIAPVSLGLGYFAARITGRFTGQRETG